MFIERLKARFQADREEKGAFANRVLLLLPESMKVAEYGGMIIEKDEYGDYYILLEYTIYKERKYFCQAKIYDFECTHDSYDNCHKTFITRAFRKLMAQDKEMGTDYINFCKIYIGEQSDKMAKIMYKREVEDMLSSID